MTPAGSAGGPCIRRRRNAEGTLVKTRIIASALLCSSLTGLASVAALADPVNDKLVIDGVEMISRAKAPEGHPFKEVLSGWLLP